MRTMVRGEAFLSKPEQLNDLYTCKDHLVNLGKLMVNLCESGLKAYFVVGDGILRSLLRPVCFRRDTVYCGSVNCSV